MRQIRAHTQQMLSRKGASLKDVVSVLTAFRDNIEDEPAITEEEDASPPQKEILRGLIAFLEGY